MGIINNIFAEIREFFTGLRTDPAGTLISLAILAVCLLFSLIIHEVAHGYVALRCGDPTAKMMGRLTLNPAKHLDPVGTVCMALLHVGWAKPVPVNPRNFRNYKRDYILVSLAGITVNLILFLISVFVYAFIRKNVSIDSYFKAYLAYFFQLLSQLNLGLAVFNLIPVPPLDGYRVLDQLVFRGRLAMNTQTMKIVYYAFLFICISGVFSSLLGTVNNGIWYFFCNLFYRMI